MLPSPGVVCTEEHGAVHGYKGTLPPPASVWHISEGPHLLQSSPWDLIHWASLVTESEVNSPSTSSFLESPVHPNPSQLPEQAWFCRVLSSTPGSWKSPSWRLFPRASDQDSNGGLDGMLLSLSATHPHQVRTGSLGIYLLHLIVYKVNSVLD